MILSTLYASQVDLHNSIVFQFLAASAADNAITFTIFLFLKLLLILPLPVCLLFLYALYLFYIAYYYSHN